MAPGRSASTDCAASQLLLHNLDGDKETFAVMDHPSPAGFNLIPKKRARLETAPRGREDESGSMCGVVWEDHDYLALVEEVLKHHGVSQERVLSASCHQGIHYLSASCPSCSLSCSCDIRQMSGLDVVVSPCLVAATGSSPCSEWLSNEIIKRWGEQSRDEVESVLGEGRFISSRIYRDTPPAAGARDSAASSTFTLIHIQEEIYTGRIRAGLETETRTPGLNFGWRWTSENTFQNFDLFQLLVRAEPGRQLDAAARPPAEFKVHSHLLPETHPQRAKWQPLRSHEAIRRRI
ncbi:unnamed protein product [Pleuronectes platessa]|uniref:Uncharacterized protein n=1 Tax=Pleuronectes platessa TaxID=8262 RepID=A0A9N7VED2_PLEPL|nr:unnamed protein product [Pleuronectes platessa]